MQSTNSAISETYSAPSCHQYHQRKTIGAPPYTIMLRTTGRLHLPGSSDCCRVGAEAEYHLNNHQAASQNSRVALSKDEMKLCMLLCTQRLSIPEADARGLLTEGQVCSLVRSSFQYRKTKGKTSIPTQIGCRHFFLCSDYNSYSISQI